MDQMIGYSIGVVWNCPWSSIKLFGNGWVFVENKLVLTSNDGFVTKLVKLHIKKCILHCKGEPKGFI